MCGGGSKAESLAQVLVPTTEEARLPSAMVKPSKNVVTWFVDEAAAAQLPSAAVAGRL